MLLCSTPGLRRREGLQEPDLARAGRPFPLDDRPTRELDAVTVAELRLGAAVGAVRVGDDPRDDLLDHLAPCRDLVSRHDARPDDIPVARVLRALRLIETHAPAYAGGGQPHMRSLGRGGGSGRSPASRGQAIGVTALAIVCPRAMPARSTDA